MELLRAGLEVRDHCIGITLLLRIEAQIGWQLSLRPALQPGVRALGLVATEVTRLIVLVRAELVPDTVRVQTDALPLRTATLALCSDKLLNILKSYEVVLLRAQRLGTVREDPRATHKRELRDAVGRRHDDSLLRML
jgi:Mg2+/Co2+ transporter CorB